MSVDTHKYIMFAEQHRVVLNQILRQSTTPLSDGPFQVQSLRGSDFLQSATSSTSQSLYVKSHQTAR